jgi:hypothetical protein
MESDPVEQSIAISDDALKLLVAQYGVRGTARVLKLDRKATNAFRKRVERAGWCRDPIIGPLAAAAVKDCRLSPVVANLSPLQAHAEEMKRLSGATRLSMARVVHSGFQHAENMPAPLVIEEAQNLKALGALGEAAHGWSGAGVSGNGLRLTFTATVAHDQPPTIDIDCEDITPEQVTEI